MVPAPATPLLTISTGGPASFPNVPIAFMALTHAYPLLILLAGGQDDNRQMNMARVVVERLALNWVRSYFTYEPVDELEPVREEVVGDGEEDVSDLEDEDNTSDESTVESRQRMVTSSESEYIKLEYVEEKWKLPETYSKQFFHPLVTADVLHSNVEIAVGNITEDYDTLEVLLLNKARFHTPADGSNAASDYYVHCHRDYQLGKRGSLTNVQYTSCFSGVLYNECGGQQGYGRIAVILLLRWKTRRQYGPPLVGHRHDFIVIPLVPVETPSYLPYPLYTMELDPRHFSYTPQDRIVESCLAVIAAGFGSEAIGMESTEMYGVAGSPILFYVLDRDRFQYPKLGQSNPLSEKHFVDMHADNGPEVMPAGEGRRCKVFLPTEELVDIQMELKLTDYMQYADVD